MHTTAHANTALVAIEFEWFCAFGYRPGASSVDVPELREQNLESSKADPA